MFFAFFSCRQDGWILLKMTLRLYLQLFKLKLLDVYVHYYWQLYVAQFFLRVILAWNRDINNYMRRYFQEFLCKLVFTYFMTRRIGKFKENP